MYDSLSELVQQTDAKANTSLMKYDVLGRLFFRQEAELTSNWEYDISRSECSTGAGAAVGQLDRAWTSVGPAYSRIECYDPLERPLQERTQIGSNNYVAGASYDAYSRIASQTFPAGYVYPAGFKVNYGYNPNGYLSELINASNNSVIWQANTVDAVGHILSDSMAAGAFTATRVYDVLDRLKSVQTGTGNTIQNDGYWYDAVGNLTQRSWIDSSDVSHSETFGYDPLNRLTAVTGPANKAFWYDAVENLTYKSDIGTYNYTPGTHQISGIVGTVNGVTNPSFAYDGNGNITSEAGLTATWTSFNMPSLLTRGASSSSFVYGPEHRRVEQAASSSSGTVTTYYVGSSFEQATTSSTGVTENRYHISVYGRRIAMLVDASNATISWRYFHQDHLSSVEVVTDQNGALVERLSYDAWGKRRNLDGTDSATPIVAIDKRGYTDQEELDGLGLVHMNARIYDPLIARFVSPDPIIQRAYDPQSHNRYAYAANQPLRFVDPSGYDIVSSGPTAGYTGAGDGNYAGGGGSYGAIASATFGLSAAAGRAGCLSCDWVVAITYLVRAGENSGTDPFASSAPNPQSTRDGQGNTAKIADDPDTITVTGSLPGFFYTATGTLFGAPSPGGFGGLVRPRSPTPPQSVILNPEYSVPSWLSDWQASQAQYVSQAEAAAGVVTSTGSVPDFVDQWAAFYGAVGSVLDRAGGRATFGSNGRFYLSGWGGGSRARITTAKISTLGKAAGGAALLVGTVWDAVQVYNGQKGPFEAGSNLVGGLVGLALPEFGVAYGLAEAFYPGGAAGALSDTYAPFANAPEGVLPMSTN